jgi:antitoxin CcdA
MTEKNLHDPLRRFRRDTAPEQLPFGRTPGPKRATRVTVDAEILQVAKEMGIDPSRVLEEALHELTRPERERRLKEEHKKAIESYDKLIEIAGVCGEELLDLDDDPAV